MKRAERRQHLKRIKKKAKKIIEGWGGKATPRTIGTVASVHGKPCSCSMCGNPRKKRHGEKTIQELKQDEKDKL